MGHHSWTHPPLLSRHLTLQNLRKAHEINFGSGAHDICWVWRTRYVLGVAHAIFFGPHGDPCEPMGTHDSSWGPMGPHGDPMEYHGNVSFFRFYYPWISHGLSMDFPWNFPWFSHSIFHGFSMYRFSMDLP